VDRDVDEINTCFGEDYRKLLLELGLCLTTRWTEPVREEIDFNVTF
jgi:hypothetical protein